MSILDENMFEKLRETDKLWAERAKIEAERKRTAQIIRYAVANILVDAYFRSLASGEITVDQADRLLANLLEQKSERLES